LIIRTAKKGAHPYLIVVGILLMLAGIAGITTGALSQEPAPPTVPEASAPADRVEPGTAVPDRAKPSTALALGPSQPSRIQIPTIGVSATFLRLGLKPSGEMETPRDPDKVGWYTESPTPGELGPSIVAGHVTWNRNPSVFFRLGSLRPGDDVHIKRADGETAVFVVTKVASYPKDRFPTAEVYGNINHAGLRLITCGGEYVKSAHRYLANVVVYARLSHAA
jgi:sortase family protein